MKFLYRLYSNNYFGIGLFIVITILAFSFLVILFFGKKDEKARNAENISKEDVQPTNTNIDGNQQQEELKAETLEPISLTNGQPDVNAPNVNTMMETPVAPAVNPVETPTPQTAPVIDTPVPPIDTPVSQPVVEPVVEANPFSLDNMTLNSDLVTTIQPTINQSSNETSNEEPKDPFISDIFSLNNALEPTAPVSNNQPESVLEPKVEEPAIDPFHVDLTTMDTPVIEEEKEENIFSEPVIAPVEQPVLQEEPVKKPAMPTQFSSVYLNKEKEEPILSVVEETPVPEVKEVTPIPVKPEFELPKTIDLPKLNKPADMPTKKNENILNSITKEKKEEALNSLFANIEEESYTIEK